jgi:hypothetical protein
MFNEENEVNEYCQLETMKGRCRWKSEVILMTSARWGRMKTGRCLNIHPTLLAATGHDPLFIGCSADVLPLLDRKCSGRSECDVRIPDADLDTVTPCYPDLTRYLDASYTCVKGTQYRCRVIRIRSVFWRPVTRVLKVYMMFQFSESHENIIHTGYNVVVKTLPKLGASWYIK